MWHRVAATSDLGGALSGLGKYAEAEPLLLRGYEGMKAREAVGLPNRTRLAEVVGRLVALYGATGRPAEAEAWRRKLPPEVAPRPRPARTD